MISKTTDLSMSEYLNLIFALNKYITNLNDDDSKNMILKLFEYAFSEYFLKSQISLDLLICNYHSSSMKSRKNFLSLLAQMVKFFHLII